MTYEEIRKELIVVIKKLEAANLDLTEALDVYARGVQLAAMANKLLDTAEGKIGKVD